MTPSTKCRFSNRASPHRPQKNLVYDSTCHEQFFLSDTARAETNRPKRAWRVRTYFFLHISCIRRPRCTKKIDLFFPTQRDNPHGQNPQQAISSRRFANEPCLDSKFEQNNTTRSKEKRTAATCRRSNVCKHRIRWNKKFHQANRLAQPADETREPKFYDQWERLSWPISRATFRSPSFRCRRLQLFLL